MELQRSVTKYPRLCGKIQQLHQQVSSKVKLNVGGTVFTSSTHTLTQVSGTIFCTMFRGNINRKNEDGEFFVDRSPKYFSFIIEFLRNKRVHWEELNDRQLEELLEEAEFYQIQPLVDILMELKQHSVHLYAVGGAIGKKTTFSVERYDHSLERWVPMPPLSCSRHCLGAATLYGQIFAIGGKTSNKKSSICSIVEKYDPESRKWCTVASLQQRRSNFGVGSANGMIFVIGGIDEQNRVLGSVEVYNPVENKWSLVAPMQEPRTSVTVTVTQNQIYVIGGWNGRKALGTVERFDPSTGTWTSLAHMLCKRTACAATVLNKKVIVAGGFDGHRELNTVEEYDPETNKWQYLATMREPRFNLAAATLHGTMYAGGGSNSIKTGKAVNTVEKFECGVWLPVPPMIENRVAFGFVAC